MITLGVNPEIIVDGEHVATMLGFSRFTADEIAPCYSPSADDREWTLIAAYEAAWERANAGPAPRRTLKEWREQ